MQIPRFTPELRRVRTALYALTHSTVSQYGALLAGALLVVAWTMPDALSLSSALWAILGLAVGAVLPHYLHRHRAVESAGNPVGALLAQDISTSQQAFSVLQQQVGATIQTSETAVFAMMERVNRIHRVSHEMSQRVTQAIEHSARMSEVSQAQAAEHAETMQRLAAHQRNYESLRSQSMERVHDVAGQVRELMPVAEQITDIARKIQIISLNATIEAARAGQAGAGFKVVADEVRRLSGETTAAARQVHDGIVHAAASIDTEFDRLRETLGVQSSDQIADIARHVETVGVTLSELVPYLSELSATMQTDVRSVTEDVLETLSQMQFQDINRQLLEQINRALGSLSDHFSQLYLLIDGKAPPPPQLLEELLQRWTNDYVMYAQRVAHSLATASESVLSLGSGAGASADPAVDEPAHTPALQMAPSSGPRIELF
ncbi:methyl-accepting chemotaxis protein [Acidovorax sp. DW039]|uniref:methyl-accepting chemotaxis protein n=1 Tax=Acidovorax sp. DW039 TaxID=3095606 RepID=UPI00308B123D|nr:methyl-accepting chemotaxis protein [Acidovorax sp. DW039]